MEYMHRIKKMLCKELEEYAEKNKLSSASDLEMIWRLTNTIKNIDKIEMFEEEKGGSSYDDDMEYSERRGRGRNARRDHMGRYSSEGGSCEDYSVGGGSSYERGSRGGYSRDDAKDHMMSKIGELMEGANPKEREALKEAMRAIERA
jgi:hypothetical protein